MLNTIQSTRLCLVWQISVVSDVELDVSGTLCILCIRYLRQENIKQRLRGIE